MKDFSAGLAAPAGGCDILEASTGKAIDEILDRGNTAEVKRRKNGEIIVLEVKKKIKATENPAPQTGGAESQTGL